MQNLLDLSQFLNHLADSLQPEAQELEHAAANQKQRILDRTSQGVGVDNQPFTGYNVHTHKQGTVNLRETGQMLDSISVEANNDQSRIYFADSEQETVASYINSGTTRTPERRFFGLSLQDRDDIVGDVRTALFKRVNL